MTSGRVVKALLSPRATMLLLCALLVLLFLNVTLPQAPVVGEEVVAESVAGRPVYGFFLVTLGFSSMATSPLFVGLLLLFLLKLAAVLLSRLGPTWRRIQVRPRAEKGLLAWTASEAAHAGRPPQGWSAGQATSVLKACGYAVQQVGESCLWGVKHRTAPLGFLIFHASFFLLFGAGVQLWYTRFVATVTLTEGQAFEGAYTQVDRIPPLGLPEPLHFRLEEVQTRFENGEPVHLGAVFRFEQGEAVSERLAVVNHPAHWGSTSLLVNRAGLSPVLWLQDAGGRTLDRVVVPIRTRGGEPTTIPLAEGRLSVSIPPLEQSQGFPERSALPQQPLWVQVESGEELLFEGPLRIGQVAELDGERLVLEDIRYWVSTRIVDERGGGLLIAGFVLGIIGLIWRLPACRREVALSWTEGEFRLVGNSEYFSQRFEGELDTIVSLLAERTPTPELSSDDRRREDETP